MDFQEYPFVLGTAGHIDHGKTTLVRRLTGVDCDRLVEEKKRGITIELGFAPLKLKNGSVISIVDVPGHEKFIRQMVAGAAGIDAVMLVIAADEGVMQQTREHLDILKLLGIHDGIVVLTKSDLVDAEFLALVTEDVQELIRGSFLDGAPLLEVSSTTGDGFPELESALMQLLERAKPRDREGALFLPIDRTFHISGFGSVITGTAYRGTVHEGEEVQILPSGLSSRVRSIQVHGASVPSAIAGQRMALNLTSVSLDQINRGDVICAAEQFRTTQCLDVSLELLPAAPEPLEHWQRVRLHMGTSDTLARVLLLDGSTIPPGGSGFAQLLIDEPLVASAGEHFIIRFYSPLQTIGGGCVLYPYANKVSGKINRQRKQEFLRQLDGVDKTADRLVFIAEELEYASVSTLRLFAQLDASVFDRKLASLEGKGHLAILRAGEPFFLSEKKMESLWLQAQEVLQLFHDAHPELSGAAVEDLIASFPFFDLRTLREFLTLCCKRGWGKAFDGRICLNDFEPRDDQAFSVSAQKGRAYVLAQGFHLPHLDTFAGDAGIDAREINRIVAYFRDSGEWRVIGDGFILDREVQNRFYEALLALKEEITVGSLRDATGTSRKYVLSLLEFFDSQGITRRVGDKRVLMKPKG